MTTVCNLKIASLGSALLLALSSNPAAADQWRIVDLGDLGGASANHLSWPFDINGRGDVVGFSTGADGKDHAFYWSQGTMTDLGEGRATSINNHRQMVGWGAGPNYLKWTYNGAGFDLPLDIGQARLGDLFKGPTVKINEMGEIAGTSLNANYFYWKDGLAISIVGGGVGGWGGCWPATVVGFNNRGAVAYDGETGVPYLFSPSAYDTAFTAVSSGYVYPTALNDAGEAVGWMGANVAPMWDINNAGIAVGGGGYDSYTGLPPFGGLRFQDAFISTDLGATKTNLNSVALVPNLTSDGWTKLLIATAVNDAGQIVGVGQKGGAYHAFLLDPVHNY